MTTDERSDERLDGAITSWLEQTAPPRLPDRVLAATFERTRGSRQHVGWRARLGRFHMARPAFALGGAVAAVLVAAVAFNAYSDRSAVGPGGPLPSDDPRSLFLGTWYSTSDADGGTQTMTVTGRPDDALEIVVTDTIATVCSLTPSTMTGTGIVDQSGRLVIPEPVYACDNGSEPKTTSGPPLLEVLRNLTYVHDAQAGDLTDNFGGIWLRQIAAASSLTPTAPPSEAEVPESPAQAIDFPDLTTTFISPRNGFSIKHPERVALTPATNLWGLGDDESDVVETGLGAVFKGASTEMPDVQNGFLVGEPSDISIDEWVDGMVESSPGGCGVPRGQQAEITIDGQPGRISECPGDPGKIEATVIANGRLYLFSLLHTRTDARAVFDAFAATIRLTPETAVDFPEPDTTFISPSYGYSFKYYDRGGLAPATELWDPGNQPLDDRNFDARFDGVETGLGAYFEGASTGIPDGVSIDGWVDEYVTPVVAGGCGVPRGQQAEITIDGQPGRIAECDHTEATVVAGGRLYLFIGPGQSSRDRAWFDAWIATIDLRPEEAP